jgi:CelD/BcsL family acetyltransferase involved in cellulose biosynthesis
MGEYNSAWNETTRCRSQINSQSQGDPLYTVTIHKTEHEFRQLRGAWNELLPHSCNDDIFLSWNWLFTWYQTLGAGTSLWIIVVQEGKDVVGIAPLLLDSKTLLGVRQPFLYNIGGMLSDISGFVILEQRPEIFDKIVECLYDQRKHWNFLALHDIPRSTMRMDIFDKRFSDHRHHMNSIGCHQYYIDLNTTWEEYFKTLSKNHRKDLKKKDTRLRKQGTIQFERFLGQEINQQHIQTIFDIQRRSHRPDLFASLNIRSFYETLSEVLIQEDVLDISILSIDGYPIAYRYGFLYRNRFEDWITGYDNAYFPYSCGKLLLMYLLQDCFSRGIKRFHFLRGEEEYKTLWRIHSVDFIHQFILSTDILSTLAFIRLPSMKHNLKKQLMTTKTLKPIMSHYEKHFAKN